MKLSSIAWECYKKKVISEKKLINFDFHHNYLSILKKTCKRVFNELIHYTVQVGGVVLLRPKGFTVDEWIHAGEIRHRAHKQLPIY